MGCIVRIFLHVYCNFLESQTNVESVAVMEFRV